MTAILQYTTPPSWFEQARVDLGALLSDHLHCERKAAENALSMVRRYPHDPGFVDALSRLAHEETSHVVQVGNLMADLGLAPRSDAANPYTRALFAEVRATEPERRVDLLLVAALIEERSHERLRLLAAGFDRIGEPRLADFYTTLANAEERHTTIFVEQAARFVTPDALRARLAQLAAHEAAVVAALPATSRVH